MTDREGEWSALMRAANAGDGRAYARLLHALAPVLRGIIRSRARNQPADQQEDILQEVLMAIHAKRHTWDAASPLLPWLYAITRYKIVDAFRRQSTAVHLPIDDFAEALAAEQADPTDMRDSDRLIGQLDPRSAEIVRAIRLRDESARSVGARLNMAEGAVRVALHRALARLMHIAREPGDK